MRFLICISCRLAASPDPCEQVEKKHVDFSPFPLCCVIRASTFSPQAAAAKEEKSIKMLLLKMLCSTDTHSHTPKNSCKLRSQHRDPIWSFRCCLRPFLLFLPTQPGGTKQQQQWESFHHCEKSVFSSHSSWACALSVCEWAKHYFFDRNLLHSFAPKLSHCWEEKRSFHSQRVVVCVGVEKQGGKEKRKRRKTPTQRQCESARQRSRAVKSRGGRGRGEGRRISFMDGFDYTTDDEIASLLRFVQQALLVGLWRRLKRAE